MLWLLLCLILGLIIIYRLHQYPKILRHGQSLRRPPNTLPLLGNAIHFLKPRHLLFDWFVKCQRQFGDETFEISVPGLPPGVVINSPENLEFVLKNETSITKGEFFRRRSWDLFGHGIINATGDLWRSQRKAGLKFFSGTNLDALIEDVLPDAYEKTRNQLLKSSEAKSQLDIQKVFLDLTTTVVGHMAYDMELDASSPFTQAFDYASDCIGLRFQNPLYRITELFSGSRLRSSIIEVKRFGRSIVANARKRRSHAAFESLITDQPVVFGSLIDSLMETFSDPTIVADSALNFLSAARDTTAQSLTWMFYALARHPQFTSTLQPNLSQLLNSSQPLRVADLQPNQIPSLIAIFYESLRLYPPVPFELKQCSNPVVLPDGTALPSGAVIVWSIWAMNRAVEVYGADAHNFRPTRWLDDQGKLIYRSAGEFAVFNGGPRACLGRKMAEVMAAWVLVHVLGEFEFEEVKGCEGEERRSKNSLTLPMEGGFPCFVKKREDIEIKTSIDL